ncbi:MAG: GAF domain-containing protein [Planctomycetota bacterium]
MDADKKLTRTTVDGGVSPSPAQSGSRFVTNRKRFIVITRFLIFAVVAVLAGREAAAEHLGIVYSVLGVFLASNIVLLFQPFQRFESERITGWIFCFDTFFVSVFVFYLRARATEFYLVYFLTIFIAASSRSSAAAAGTSLVTAVIYGVLTKYGKTGVELHSVSFVMRVIFFFVTAMVVGYFAEQVKKEREAREAAQRMLRLSSRLATLFDISQKMVSTVDLDELARHVFRSAVQVLGADSGSLMLLDEANSTLAVKESIGLKPEAQSQKVNLGEGIAGVVAQEGEAVLLKGDAGNDPRHRPMATGRNISSSVCAPLRIGSKVLGVLNMNRGSDRQVFAEEDLELLAALANHAAIVIEKVKLHERLAQAYDASKRRYHTLVDTAHAMIFTTDSSGILTFVNKHGCQMLGRSLSELEGRSIFDLLHAEDGPKFKECLHDVTNQRKDVGRVEYRVASQNGEWRQYAASCSPLVDATNNTCLLLGVAEDITNYVAMQQRLMRSAKLATVGTMVAGIAHELNNPLVGVIGFAELLKEREDVRKLINGELDFILQQAARCVNIVNGLLRFARQEETSREQVDVNEILRESLDLRRHELSVRNIALIEDYDPDLPVTFADRSQMQQVFVNIISNAFDAITERNDAGSLRVRTWRSGNTIAAEFSDDGGGIKEIEKIFDPFYTTKEVGKGTGLGLSIAYGILEEHGGHIEARNNETGAVFTVTLPASVVSEPDSRPCDKEAADSHSASVLIVDDEDFILRICSNALRSMGHNVTTAHTAAEALESLQKGDYDLILTDIRMPGGMDGRGLYQWLKQNRPGIADRIIFTTGDTVSPEIQKFVLQTGVGYLIKPFRLSTFRKIIQKALLSRCA